jgi:hypothetical protein
MFALWLSLVLQSPDSQATLRAARTAQAQFESFRARNVPQADDYSHSCDLHVGRFCFWYVDRQADSVPEPVAIRQARAGLLARLADAAALLPGDDWIAGQRARYLIEDGRPGEAVALGRDCRATEWWCAALAGLALHAAGDFAQSDSAFTAALQAMPQEERCRWHDVSLLLPRELRTRYDGMSCEERIGFESHWWWLAAPLLSRPGNDRRTEHYARLTLARVLRESRTARDDVWGDDSRELLVRFGAEVAWTRRPASAMSLSDPAVTGHERVPAFHFVPSAHAFDDPSHARPEDWALGEPHPSELYAPSYADQFVRLEAQLATFRRGDSCLVIAAYDASLKARPHHRAARAALVLAREGWPPVVTARETQLDGPEVLTATGWCGLQIVSLEIVDAEGRWVARARRGFAPAPGEVSDLLLFDAIDSVGSDLASATQHALAISNVRADRPLGLYWEVGGLTPAGEEVTTSVSVTRRGRGWFRRAVEAIGIATPGRGVRLEWSEILVPRAETATVAGRALGLDLAGLASGSYHIEVTVTRRGRAPITVGRDIELVRR